MMTRDFEKWALTVLKKYQKILLLDDHTLSFKYRPLAKDIVMEHDCNYPYKDASIWYGDMALEWWKKKKHEDLKQVMIHELCHAIVFPLAEVAGSRFVTRETVDNEMERLTDHIANVIIKYESN